MAFLPDTEGEAEGFKEVTSGSGVAVTDVVWSGSSAHSLDGFAVKLFWATEAQLLKIAGLRAEDGTHKFQGTFDRDALIAAGLDARGSFEAHLDTVRYGLRGDDDNIQCSAKLKGSESLVLVISESVRRQRYEYSLPLARVELSESDKVQLELDKSKAEVANLRQENDSLHATVNALKRELTEKGKAVDDCNQQIDTLRATVSTLEKSLFEKDEAIRELKGRLSLRSKKVAISSAKPRVESRSAAVVGLAEDRKEDNGFVFDLTKAGGITKPEYFKVTTDGKVAKRIVPGFGCGSSQILLRPSMSEATHTIRFKVIEFHSYNPSAIGFTDTVSDSIKDICAFSTSGRAYIGGVLKRLHFSRDAQSGDIWTLSVDLSKGEVHVSASNLKRCTFQWVPKRLPVFAAFSGWQSGDSVAIV